MKNRRCQLPTVTVHIPGRRAPFGWCFMVAATVAALDACCTLAAEDRFWALSHYDVHVAVAVDDRIRPQRELGSQLTAFLSARIDATLNPLWQAEVVQTSVRRLSEEAGGLTTMPFDELPGPLRRFDKLLTLVVTAVPTGYRLQVREYDVYLRRWGPLHEIAVQQSTFLGERAFSALVEAFAPLAVITPLPDDPGHVRLTLRGSGLPRRTDELIFLQAGQVFEPVLRRTNRSGELVGGAVASVPWTYLTAVETDADQARARVHSGVRRPFNVRRRGRVQQIALTLRTAPAATRVRFHARTSAERGLAGYEVFRRTPAAAESTFLGTTDADGVFTLQSTERAVIMLFLRSDGRLLAKVPIVPGAQRQVEVPIADDPARLRAQAELTTIREELIDLVAQRAILISRTRALLEKNEVSKAQELVNQLSGLPSRSVFDQQIAAAERSVQLDDLQDEKVRETVTKMFADTRNLLARFLDSRPISRLQTEVTQKRSQDAF